MLYKSKSRLKGKSRAITSTAVQVYFYLTVFVVKKILILKSIKKYFTSHLNTYRYNIINFILDNFHIIIKVDCVSNMLK